MKKWRSQNNRRSSGTLSTSTWWPTSLNWTPPRKSTIDWTTLLNYNVIPGFEELMARCIQEESREEEQEIPMLKGPPAAFSSHAKKRNNSGTKSKGKARPKARRK